MKNAGLSEPFGIQIPNKLFNVSIFEFVVSDCLFFAVVNVGFVGEFRAVAESFTIRWWTVETPCELLLQAVQLKITKYNRNFIMIMVSLYHPPLKPSFNAAS